MSTYPAYQTTTLASGVHLAYLDSWGDKSDLPRSYTTIIALHGAGCNSAAWNPVLPYLPPNVRFLAYNQRSYAGSSEAFVGQEDGGIDVTAAYLNDLLGFMGFAVDRLGVAGIGSDGKGGVALLGWSKGTVPLFALLAARLRPTPTSFLSFVSPNVLDDCPFLASHLRSLMLFDPPAVFLGASPTPDMLAFMASVLPPNEPTDQEFAAALASWAASANANAGAAALGPHSAQDVLSAVGMEASGPGCAKHGALGWGLAPSAQVTRKLAGRAVKGAAWPVGVVHGDCTIENCLRGVAMVQGWWAEAKAEGMDEQPTQVRVIEGANHFAHVLKPGEFAAAVVGLVEELNRVVRWF